MQLKEKIYNLIILDESGSMQSIKNLVISGFNEVVQTVQAVAKEYPEQEHFISLISFNSMHMKTHLDRAPVAALNEINGENYRPSSGTPLFDAMGYGINELRENIGNSNVLVTILTDGLENASKEYGSSAIKALVEEMEEKKWTFTYIGTDHNVDLFAKSIAIKNTQSFAKNQAGVEKMFTKEKISRISYMRKIREKRSTKEGFYDED